VFPIISENDFDGLVSMLNEIYDDEVSIRRGIGNSFLITNGDMELYFRFLFSRLTIARIDVGLDRTRQGIGTRILEWFKSYCRLHNLDEIMLECVLSQECANFAMKHGFVRRNMDCYDWILSI
jgi:GNAT superfamily N-acetyltransferase